ncbi:MAG: hypothetical protein HYT97_02700 [Elusimicrobia bacterium]|nr:hypothetical protein [Elusimicrobiota bacterium]
MLSQTVKKNLSVTLIQICLTICIITRTAWSTPSTTYWTPCVIDIQGYKVGHVTYDNYTTLTKKGLTNGGSAFANDLGLTVGILPFQKFQMEVGFDWMEPTDYPLSFNTKAGAPEGALFNGSPALQIGIFNVGTEKDVSDQNIGYIVTGRSLPAKLGRVHLSAYLGNSKVLKDSNGNKENTGFMAAYDYGFWSAQSNDGEFNRMVLAADYASGKNAIGGGGVGLYYYFSKNVDLLVGPVWFNDTAANGAWKWTTQLDINF